MQSQCTMNANANENGMYKEMKNGKGKKKRPSSPSPVAVVSSYGRIMPAIAISRSFLRASSLSSTGFALLLMLLSQ